MSVFSLPNSPAVTRLKTSSKGLANKPGENNCFLNCAVQVLWHLPAFRNSLSEISGHRCTGAAQACIFCALKVTFTQMLYSGARTLLPDSLRRALASSFSHEQRFQLGDMDDAAECLENIVGRLHLHLCEDPVDACTAPHCISHRRFNTNLIEQIQCSCGASGSPLPFTQTIQYVSTDALISQIRHLLNSSTYQPQLFGQIVCKAVHAGDLRDCPKKCGYKVQLSRKLVDYPDIVTLGLSWNTRKPDAGRLRDILESIHCQLQLSDLFETPETAPGNRGNAPIPPDPLELTCVVCYYGHHYSAFCLATGDQGWTFYDDHLVTQIGRNWSEVVKKSILNHLQPILLIYSDPRAPPVNISTAMKSTIPVALDYFRSSGTKVQNRNQPRHHASTEDMLRGGGSRSGPPSLPPRPPHLTAHNTNQQATPYPGGTMTVGRRGARPQFDPHNQMLPARARPRTQSADRRGPVMVKSSSQGNFPVGNAFTCDSSPNSTLTRKSNPTGPFINGRHSTTPMASSPSCPLISAKTTIDSSADYISRAKVAEILQLQRRHRSSSAASSGRSASVQSCPAGTSGPVVVPSTAVYGAPPPLSGMGGDERASKVSSVTSDSGFSGDGGYQQQLSGPQSPSGLTSPRGTTELPTAAFRWPGSSLTSNTDRNFIYGTVPRRPPMRTEIQRPPPHPATNHKPPTSLIDEPVTSPVQRGQVGSHWPVGPGSLSSSDADTCVGPIEDKKQEPTKKQICPNCRCSEGWREDRSVCLKCKATFSGSEMARRNSVQSNTSSDTNASSNQAKPSNLVNGTGRKIPTNFLRPRKTVQFHEQCIVVPPSPGSESDDGEDGGFRQRWRKTRPELAAAIFNHETSASIASNSQQERVLPVANSNPSTTCSSGPQQAIASPPQNNKSPLNLCNLCHNETVASATTVYCLACSHYMAKFEQN